MTRPLFQPGNGGLIGAQGQGNFTLAVAQKKSLPNQPGIHLGHAIENIADKEPRQPFTEHELQTIRENFDPFTEPLFIIAMATALREGDICTLKWSEIDFENRVIRRSKMRKTGKSVDEVTAACERDNFMTADEAADYGLIDKVITKR